jgi:acetyltransferase-like isoleucine patch superfamily enzyme
MFKEIISLIYDIVISRFVKPQGHYHVGKHTYGQPKILSLSNISNITIGKYCSIGPGVVIIGQGAVHTYKHMANFPLNWRFTPEIASELTAAECIKKPTKIGNDVWIGVNVIILSGISVGNGAVIGAGSVVTHDVPAFAVAAGNPAKIISYRFTPKQIESLQQIAWWNWSEKTIIDNIRDFYVNPDVFINKWR